jgi:hypothetical protein
VGSRTKLADPANADANNRPGRPRIRLEQVAAHNRRQQVDPTTVVGAGRPESCYGSEGWGSNPSETSERARAAMRGHPLSVTRNTRSTAPTRPSSERDRQDVAAMTPARAERSS